MLLAVYGGAVVALFMVSAYFAFSLFVRSGATRVPSIVGMSVDEATQALAEKDLKLEAPDGSEIYSDKVPAGHVARQDPGEGSLAKRGGTVHVIVSLGPQEVTVPNLSGKTVAVADVDLAGVGLSTAPTVEVYSSRGELGQIVQQFPPAGGKVSRSSGVTLFVSRGDPSDTYVMPDLVTRSYDSVRAFFKRHGFELGSVKFEPYEGASAGTVLRQFPLAGHPLKHDEVISLVVAAPPAGAEAKTPS